MMGELSGKTAMVTGATRNTGFVIAEAFASAGARVYLNGRDADRTHAAAARLSGDVLPLPGDVGQATDVAAMFSRIRDSGHGLDILVNNAVIQGIGGRFDAVTDTSFEEVFRVNVFGYFRCGREAANLMAERGGGTIVNVGSNVSDRAIRNRCAYVASKGAIDALTRAMAVDLAPLGIRVNQVAPGYIHTDRWDTLAIDVAQRRRANIPIKREASGADIANAVLFFASDQSASATGARLVVDGGCAAQHLPADCDG